MRAQVSCNQRNVAACWLRSQCRSLQMLQVPTCSFHMSFIIWDTKWDETGLAVAAGGMFRVVERGPLESDEMQLSWTTRIVCIIHPPQWYQSCTCHVHFSLGLSMDEKECEVIVARIHILVQPRSSLDHFTPETVKQASVAQLRRTAEIYLASDGHQDECDHGVAGAQR